MRNTRSSLGFETSAPGFALEQSESADAEFESLVALAPNAVISEQARNEYASDPARLLYEASLQGAGHAWLLGDPDRAPDQAARTALMQQDPEPDLAARDWLRWAHARPWHRDALAAMQRRADRIDAAFAAQPPDAPATPEYERVAEIFARGGPGAMAGYLLHRRYYDGWTEPDIRDFRDRAEALARAFSSVRTADGIFWTRMAVLRAALPYAIGRYLAGRPQPRHALALAVELDGFSLARPLADLVEYAARAADGPDDYIQAFSRGSSEGDYYIIGADSRESDEPYADALRASLPGFYRRLPPAERAGFLERLGYRVTARFGAWAFRALLDAVIPLMNDIEEFRALGRTATSTFFRQQGLGPILAERAQALVDLPAAPHPTDAYMSLMALPLPPGEPDRLMGQLMRRLRGGSLTCAAFRTELVF